MGTIFGNLPSAIINNIISYITTIKYRNGKYIDAIPSDDIRYILLSKTLKQIPKEKSKYYTFQLINKKSSEWYGYLLTYFFLNDTNNISHLLNIQRLTRKNDGYDKYYMFGKKSSYIFTSNNKWERIIDYAM